MGIKARDRELSLDEILRTALADLSKMSPAAAELLVSLANDGSLERHNTHSELLAVGDRVLGLLLGGEIEGEV